MKNNNTREGKFMHDLAGRLFPIGRSLTGDGVRQTLSVLKEYIPLKVYEIPTGTKAFDWTVPKEWNIRDAHIIDPSGRKIADYKANNLHVVGYSVPVDREVSLEELQRHLHSIEGQPDAVPYVTSYYSKNWGFCLSHRERRSLKRGKYRVRIDSELRNGSLTYGELIIPGRSKKEIFLSTYICHPSLANNELSGPVLAVALARRLLKTRRKYTYRIIFIPETIGSLVYASRNLKLLRENVVAGFVLTCVGDDRGYSFVASRNGDTLADRVALRALKARHPDFKHWTYMNRGSDERNYCSPGADLPVVSMMRSRYGTYPEYHTSLDDMSFITPSGLQGSYDLHMEVIGSLEREPLYRAVNIGEPQLGKRGLYPTLSRNGSVSDLSYDLLNILAYSDGTRLPVDIAEFLKMPLAKLKRYIKILIDHRLIVEM